MNGPRRRDLLIGAALAAASPALAQPEAGRFARLLDAVRTEALAAGIRAATIDAALAGLTPDPAVLERARRQGEFSRPIAAYVEGAASAGRVAQGRTLAGRWAAVLDRTDARDGVPPAIVLAIWAAESGFGSDTGGFDTIRSLATLASLGEREDFFRTEFVAALRILDGNHVARDAMRGSWAGATGQAQFMPTSFFKFAVDQDGDGRRDIWTSVPDVLGSISTFIAGSGWARDLPWGFEAALPPSPDLSVHERAFGEWRGLGLRRADGKPWPSAGTGRLFMPAGIGGPAFLLTDNFEALRAYNTSDSYALGIGLLADRIAGAGPLSRAWPKAPVLTPDERREVHRRLATLGLYAGTPDGKFGAQTRDAVRRFQVGRGMVADGYADATVLTALRKPR